MLSFVFLVFDRREVQEREAQKELVDTQMQITTMLRERWEQYRSDLLIKLAQHLTISGRFQMLRSFRIWQEYPSARQELAALAGTLESIGAFICITYTFFQSAVS